MGREYVYVKSRWRGQGLGVVRRQLGWWVCRDFVLSYYVSDEECGSFFGDIWIMFGFLGGWARLVRILVGEVRWFGWEVIPLGYFTSMKII